MFVPCPAEAADPLKNRRSRAIYDRRSRSRSKARAFPLISIFVQVPENRRIDPQGQFVAVESVEFSPMYFNGLSN